MSDIAIGEIPFFYVVIGLGAYYWPVTLLAGVVGLYVGATRLRGIGRIVCLVVFLLFILDAGFGIFGFPE